MPGILCEHCTAVCCRYIALPIDTPTEQSEFDAIRWYLLHDGIMVFVEDGDWYICMSTTCRHLRPDHLCGIYETRPQICRDYSTANCDYHSGDYGWSHHFTAPEHLDEYVRLHFRPKAQKKAASRRKPGRPGLRAKARVKLRTRTRTPAPTDYAAQSRDIRGVPLPVLALQRD